MNNNRFLVCFVFYNKTAEASHTPYFSVVRQETTTRALQGGASLLGLHFQVTDHQ